MEQHEGVYEQIIEVNNANQGAEFLSQQLVQEIVVQNDNELTTVNCEMSNIEIMLPNECVNVQEQCNSTVTITCNNDGIGYEKQTETVILQESIKDQTISQMNNVEENITNFNESHKQEKIEEFILRSESPYHEANFHANDTVSVITEEIPEIVKKESTSEKIMDTIVSVPVNSVNESVPVKTEGETIQNHNVNHSENIVENSNVGENKDDQSCKEHENELVSEKEAENCVASMQAEIIEAMEVENTPIVNEVVNDSVVASVEQSQTPVENHCADGKEKESSTIPDKPEEEIALQNSEKDSDVVSENVDVAEYPILTTEPLTDSKAIMNSDDVAVLTEFNSIEYNIEVETLQDEVGIVDIPEKQQEEENQNKTEVSNNDIQGLNLDPEIVKEEQVEISNSLEKLITEVENKQEETNKNDETYDEDDDDLELHLSTQSSENQRKVIQDIFDDWQDENGEDDNNPSSAAFKEQHDSVEMELQNLLNDDSHQGHTTELNSNENCKESEPSTDSTSAKSKTVNLDKLTPANKNSNNKSPKSVTNSTKEHPSRASKTIQEQVDPKQKLQSPRPGVKVPGMHLTSQIASTAEVTELLKERLREKQKDLVVPKTADLVFVKKITQRLSSQLSAAAAATAATTTAPASSNVPSLIPLKPSEAEDETTPSAGDDLMSKTNSDKELLAILEGDVDPDWSNLKPQSTEETAKTPGSGEAAITTTSGSKLDPVIERELALKQLLELPNISTKKNSSGTAPKKTKKNLRGAKSANGQADSKLNDDANKSKVDETINLDSTEEDSPKKDKTPKALKENNNQNARGNSTPTTEHSAEESRSGRKRKLTEKAREHEMTVKRQKVFKGKVVTENKKQTSESEESSKPKSDKVEKADKVDKADKEDTNSSSIAESATESSSPSTPKPNQTRAETKATRSETRQTKLETRQSATKTPVKGKMTPVKRPKLGLVKKDAPISKRKLAVKNLIRQKMASKKSAAGVKAKPQVTTTPKVVSSAKATPEKSTSTPPATKTKKVATEIDKLLQDEGVVNLLYDVEQPDSRRRLVPITKSQKKIMDVEKAERELKLRTKLVRNAVLRLRNSGSSTVKISPRSRRNVSGATSSDQSPVQAEKKTNEQSKSPKTPSASTAPSVPSDFIIPAKIRNAADASRIIRRHSSSSFSSASASPRVSIDMPSEQIKTEDSETYVKSKRKLSQDSTDKNDTKKNKKKIAPKAEVETKETNEKSPVKKEPIKKVTRSNFALAAAAATPVSTKLISRNKKVPKSKASPDATSNDTKTSPKSQDELSACLAEAANALLTGISGSRSSNTSTNRKKGSTNVAKATDDEKIDVKKLFSNKEINVRQHGHLVQLILTPSTPVSGIRNAITIQVMNELREALSILKNDDECRVVLFTSTGTSFCEGLELSSLLHSNKEERKTRAEEMAKAVKEFIKTLSSFNKPIVAGVQGAAIGLGVTMLPLFDLVIASDKATFSTPYGKLGQIAEGAAVLTLSHSLGSAVTNELLLGGRTLTASEALRAGLVTRVLWPDRFQGELLPSLKSMSEQSSQSMESTKALLRQSLRQKLNASLDSETLLLVKHWSSLECQDAIKAYIDEKGQ